MLKLIQTKLKPGQKLANRRKPVPSGSIYFYTQHAIKNIANQSTLKPLFIRRYYIQPSDHAARVCRTDCAGHCISYGLLWHGMK